MEGRSAPQGTAVAAGTVLAYFAQRPERVISVKELRKAVWGGPRVGRGGIRVCVREIRQVLGDEAATPRYVETVVRTQS